MQHTVILMFSLKLAKKGSWAGDIQVKTENVNEILNERVVFVKTYGRNVSNDKYFHKPSFIKNASMGTNWINWRINSVKKEFTPT